MERHHTRHLGIQVNQQPPTTIQHQPMRSAVSQPPEMWHEEVAEIQPQVPEGGQDPQQGAEAHDVREDIHPRPARGNFIERCWSFTLVSRLYGGVPICKTACHFDHPMWGLKLDGITCKICKQIRGGSAQTASAPPGFAGQGMLQGAGVD